MTPMYPGMMDTSQEHLGSRAKLASGLYDFAVDGGAISAIPLNPAATIPSGALVYGGWLRVLTQCTSGGAATIALAVESAGDIVPNSVAIGAWTVGMKKVAPNLAGAADLSASGVILTTAARNITMTIATQTLTAGKFQVVLFYVDPLEAV